MPGDGGPRDDATPYELTAVQGEARAPEEGAVEVEDRDAEAGMRRQPRRPDGRPVGRGVVMNRLVSPHVPMVPSPGEHAGTVRRPLGELSMARQSAVGGRRSAIGAGRSARDPQRPEGCRPCRSRVSAGDRSSCARAGPASGDGGGGGPASWRPAASGHGRCPSMPPIVRCDWAVRPRYGAFVSQELLGREPRTSRPWPLRAHRAELVIAPIAERPGLPDRVSVAAGLAPVLGATLALPG